MSEDQLLRCVLDLARLRLWKVHHCRASRRGDGSWATAIQGDAGFPDLVLARRGLLLVVELKSEHGRLRDEQKAWRAELNFGLYFLWRPRDWHSGEIERALR